LKQQDKPLLLRQHDNSFFGDPLLFQLTSALHPPLLSEFSELGAYAASHETQERAALAHRHKPLLYVHDMAGARYDKMDLHPAYHSLLTRARHAGIASSLFDGQMSQLHLCHRARAIRLFLLAGVETGCLHQLCLSSAAFHVLHANPEQLSMWQSLLSSPIHDPSEKPHRQKQGALLSWAISEYHDNTTQTSSPQTYARHTQEADKASSIAVCINGEKAAIINPLADGFLVNAEFLEKNCLFLVPRLLDDGRLNGISLYPVAHENSTSSYPCADMRFRNSLGWMVGEVGDAPHFIKKLQDALQFDHAVMTAGIARRALRLAIDQMRHDTRNSPSHDAHIAQKSALLARFYADAALDCVAVTWLVMRMAQALDLAAQKPEEAELATLLLPVCGFWLPRLVTQIIDCVTMGSDATQTQTGTFHHRTACYFSRNRRLERRPTEMLLHCFSALNSPLPHFDMLIDEITANLGPIGKRMAEFLRLSAKMTREDISVSCFLIEQLGYSVAASGMKGLDMEIVTTAFINSRLGGQWRSTYGMLNPRFNPVFILETLYPSA